MSHQAIADAFAPTEAKYKEEVMQLTWGHLAPRKNKHYQGSILFAKSEYGDCIPINIKFKDLDDSPWLFQDVLDFIGKTALVGVHKFSGEYFNHEFFGEVKLCKILE